MVKYLLKYDEGDKFFRNIYDAYDFLRNYYINNYDDAWEDGGFEDEFPIFNVIDKVLTNNSYTFIDEKIIKIQKST